MSRLRELRRGHEDGFTLIELMVAMFILVAFMAVFSAAFLEVQHGVRKQNDEVDSQAALRKAFNLFDGGAVQTTTGTLTGPVGVRYANALNNPAASNGSQYIEWQSGDVGLANGVQTCTQWRATAAGLLQWRQWTYMSAVTQPTWNTAATGVKVTGTPVFSTTPAISSNNSVERQLQVTLTASNGLPSSSAANQSVYAASNTSSPTAPSPAVCQDLTPARP